MSKPETIKIDEIEYVRKDAIHPITTGALRIVILQRGWVFVGRFTRTGNDCLLTNAAVIRIWGTTKGLGQIAEGGPTSITVLDRCPDVRFNELTTVAYIDCVESKWTSL